MSQMKWRVVVLIMLFQFVLMEIVNCSPEYSSKYSINYDLDFDDVASYWRYSSWNNHSNPSDYWMKAENGVITLYYKANRTDWGNTEVYQGKKPAFEVEKSLRFRDFLYKEGSGGLNLSAKVRRDIDPIWQGSPLSDKSPYPQANIGIYLWLEVRGWNYDDWSKTSSLVIDIYFDSRHQDPSTSETKIWEVGGSYPPTTTPYDPQIHAGYVIGTLPLNAWQEFNVSISDYIDQTLQKCRDRGIQLPSNEVAIKFFGVYVDSFSAAVQASFDYVQLEYTSVEELDSMHVELENIRNFMYVFLITTIVFMITTVFAVKKVYTLKRKLSHSSREN